MGFVVAVHGGAGRIDRATLTDAREASCRAGLRLALERAGDVLRAGGSALDAAVRAVEVLEDDPGFNAGRGSVLTSAGTIEMDAAVMEGTQRRAGAVTCVRTVRHPVRLARAVMEHTPHVLLADAGAEALADRLGLERVDPSWLLTDARREQLERAQGRVGLDHGDDARGTVGAVAVDARGRLAAATSTGGLVNQLPGRVGDTPVIGAGTWAWDRTCAVSATGHGEIFVRGAVGSRISAWMEIGGLSLEEAARRVVHEELVDLGGEGGVIAVDARGNVALPFNSGGMYRGVLREDGTVEVAIW